MVETVSLELTKDELTTLDIMFDLGVGRADELRNTSNQTVEAMVGRIVLKGAHIAYLRTKISGTINLLVAESRQTEQPETIEPVQRKRTLRL